MNQLCQKYDDFYHEDNHCARENELALTILSILVTSHQESYPLEYPLTQRVAVWPGENETPSLAGGGMGFFCNDFFLKCRLWNFPSEVNISFANPQFELENRGNFQGQFPLPPFTFVEAIETLRKN